MVRAARKPPTFERFVFCFFLFYSNPYGPEKFRELSPEKWIAVTHEMRQPVAPIRKCVGDGGSRPADKAVLVHADEVDIMNGLGVRLGKLR
jgi:hypothetical protein